MPDTAGNAIDARTLSDWLSRSRAVKLLDVRSPAEFESVHISGSYNVPVGVLGEHVTRIARKLSEEVVVVCQSGARARHAGARLEAEGLSGVHVLQGGIAAYASAGGEVVRGRIRWDLERQVRFVAGSLVLSGALGSIRFRSLLGVSGAVGAGLAISALSNTCTMGDLLMRLPYNRPSLSQEADRGVEGLLSAGD